MHVLFLTDNFPPEGNAPASRTFEHAREWVKSGIDVTVITCAPNFPEGKVFEGYKNRWFEKGEIEGVNVLRVKTYVTANEGFVKRILDYMSFMLSSFICGLFVRRVDVIVATSPQFFTTVSGWLLGVIKSRPFVFELRDIWPASITAVGAMKKGFLIRCFERLEMFLYRKSSRIISVTHSFKEELVGRGIDSHKISVVLNGVDTDIYYPRDRGANNYRESLGLHGKFVVGYVGTHGLAHSLESLVDAAELLDNDKIVFLFAGGGAGKKGLDDYIESKALKNVISVDRVPKVDMPELWAACDVSLVHLKNAKLFETVIPSKIFESMGMGLPIVIGVPEGEATTIVRESNSGLVVSPENSKEIAEAVMSLFRDEALLNNLKSSSLDASARYCRRSLAQEMASVLKCVSEENK